MKFNEDSRVKIPTILHLMKLGYEYVSLKGTKCDEETNIFTDIFNDSIHRINPELNEHDIQRIYSEVSLSLENEDLGKVFYEKLINQSVDRLIDLEDFNNNSFHVCTELTYKKDDDEFRPDIILLINGMPLLFIEVKKSNNYDGIIAERNRIYTRFQNTKFKKFINLTQLSVQQQLTTPAVSKFKIICPSDEILQKFDSIVDPMIEKMELVKKENQKLSELRDWLLPMLMNGQVTIKEAEEKLSMAAEPEATYNK